MGRKLLAEGLGTFALVFCLTCDIVRGGAGMVGVALTLGFTVMVMIYALGRISGAHFNPAVTFGMVLAKRMTLRDAVPYWVAQCVGAVLASLALWLLLPHSEPNFPYVMGLGETQPSGEGFGAVLRSLFMEVGLTAFLVLVVLRVADGPKEMSLLAGIAVGAVLAADVLVGGTISGASMNPARSLGPALMMMKFDHFWIYIVGPLVGAAVAVGLDGVLEVGSGQRDAK